MDESLSDYRDYRSSREETLSPERRTSRRVGPETGGPQESEDGVRRDDTTVER